MKKLFLSWVVAQLFNNASIYAQQAFDLVFKNAIIVDGTGTRAYKGMIGVKEGKIAYVGKSISFKAMTTIDAKQKIVAPGFIDVHHIRS